MTKVMEDGDWAVSQVVGAGGGWSVDQFKKGCVRLSVEKGMQVLSHVPKDLEREWQ